MQTQSMDSVVKRRGFACIHCRKRKVKCSGDEPCVNCEKRNVVCNYPVTRKRRTKINKMVENSNVKLYLSDINQIGGDNHPTMTPDYINLKSEVKIANDLAAKVNPESNTSDTSSNILTADSNINTPVSSSDHPQTVTTDSIAKINLAETTKFSTQSNDLNNGMRYNQNITANNIKNNNNNSINGYRRGLGFTNGIQTTNAVLSATDMISTENHWTSPAFDLIVPDSSISSMISKNVKCTNSRNDDLPRHKSPWFSYSLDKYRFHRRYQSVLPYYFAGSLLSQLPQELILSNELERPRIQNYGFNLAGGKFPQISYNSGIENNSHFWDFNNSKHLKIIRKLLKYYFDEINPIFNIIHEEIFWKQFDTKFLTINCNNQNNDRSDILFKSMLYLIIITAIRFIDGGVKSEVHNLKDFELELIRSELKMEHDLFNYSYHIVSTLSFEWESFELIQSWLLIAFYLRSCHRQTSCWSALSEAIRICKGMSLELNQFPLNHRQYDELKAWHCYWCCFIIDKVFSFQIGRTYQLELPMDDMIKPESLESVQKLNFKTWFKQETFSMFNLSQIIFEFQKCKIEEMPLNQSTNFRNQLNHWLITYQDKSKKTSGGYIEKLFVLQPIMTYIDVALTFELRSIFPILDSPKEFQKPMPFALPLNLDYLLSICKLSLEITNKIVGEGKFLIPWLSNLSNLFTLTLISLIMSYLGLQVSEYKIILNNVMLLWRKIKNTKAINEPVMLQECLWCIKMLNHICCTRLNYSSQLMENIISFNHGDSIANKNKFEQFHRVGEKAGQDAASKENNVSPTSVADTSTNSVRTLRSGRFEEGESSIETQVEHHDEFLTQDLLSSLQWFNENFA